MRDESTYGGALNEPMGEEPAVQGPYYGVHGWLKFLVVMNLYIVPVLFVLSYIGTLGDYFTASPGDRANSWLVFIRGAGGLVFVIWGILVARQLRDIKPRAVRNCKTILIAGSVYLILVTLLAYKLDPVYEGVPFFAVVITVFFFLIPTFIWYTYFSVSKRVKATYPDWDA
jgi:hypothetical protein